MVAKFTRTSEADRLGGVHAFAIRWVLLFALVLLSETGSIKDVRAAEIDPAVCAECHEGVDTTAFEKSVHGDFSCTDCHVNGPFGEHEEAPAKVDCSTCHDEEAANYIQSIHGRARKEGHTEAPDCAGCHGNPHAILPSSDPASKHARQNIATMCARCHADPKIIKKFNIPFPDALKSYERSVHGRQLAKGNMKAAVCSDCHGAHVVQPGREMDSRTAKRKIPETCGRCHEDVFKKYEISIHGQAVARGNPDAPACTGCHGEHGILEPSRPDSPVSEGQLATKTCGHCHEDLTLARKYGFPSGRLSTYMASYHGMAVRRGALTVANCSSCHGVHEILPSTDPRSSIAPSNLVNTCGKCHGGASKAFVTVPVHLETSPSENPILYYVRVLYLWMIFGTIGVMLLHNGMIYAAAVRAKIRSQRSSKAYARFTTIQLVSHAMLFTSFITLVITGFALHFSRAGWTIVLDWFHIDETLRRIIHRTAACVMLGAGAIHIAYALGSKHGRYDFNALLPRLSDIREALQNIKHYLGRLGWSAFKTEQPRFGRYVYIEKIEYWALVWGTIVMSTSGFCLWFPTFFSQFLPKWGIPLAELIHYYEAWLATLAILVWHFFFVIFNPDEFPMSVTWMTGKVTEEEMHHLHPRELEESNDPTNPSDQPESF